MKKYTHFLLLILLVIILNLQTTTVFANERTKILHSPSLVIDEIVGQIVDEQGSPLIGVNIIIKESQAGTSTDAEGKFKLTNVADDATLLISYIGYLSVEIPVNGRTIINVVLIENSQTLEQLVVVGYGTQKKVNLTGSVSTVDMVGTLENRPITNASQALGGKTTGVWVSQNSGQPGSDGAQIRIRGWGTLNNANPLILIDGIEGSINEINPNDIENISVLKDAASAAIYGSKAANGVVLITTKSGKFNEAPKINISSYVGSQKLAQQYDIIENSAEYMDLWNQALVNAGGSDLFPSTLIDAYRQNNDPYKYPNVNFFDEIFKTAMIQEHNVSVRGGSANSRYYISGNYLDQDGTMLNSGSKRYGITLNLESQVNNWLSIGGRLNAIRKETTQPFDFGRVLYIFANGAYPFTAPYTQDGRYGAPEAINNGNVIVGNRNPVIEAENGLTTFENNFLKMNVFGDINLTKNLILKTSFSTQINHNLRDRHNEVLYGYTSTGLQTLNLDYPTTLEASRNNEDNYFYTWFNTLNWSHTFNNRHDVSGLLGMQIENLEIKNSYSRRSNPPKSGLYQVDAGTSGIQANGNLNAFRMMSYFGRINYAFDGKYLLEGNLRADASSRFLKGNRWGIFPSFSAGWRISEEAFMQDQNLFSNLKFRLSAGKLGNQNIDDYWPYLTVINQGNGQSYNYGGSFAPGAAITSLVDPNISWETTNNYGFGVEMGFFDNKFNVEADFFHKKTYDIIVRLPVSKLVGGLDAPFENVGEMKNQGVELNFNYGNYQSNLEKLNYSINFNITYIDNLVTKFRDGTSPDQLYLIREGYSYRTLYGLKYDGVYETDEEAKQHMHSNGYLPRAGEIRFQDLNNDGKINFEDKVDLGNTIPKFTYGLTLNLALKGFDFNALFQGIAKVNAYTQNAWTQPLGISGGTITTKWRGAWTPENNQSNIPAIAINNSWNGQESDFWTTNISFLKLKNIQLGYTLPKSILEKIQSDKVYVYLNAQNIYSFVSNEYEGFDPERNTFDSGYNYYPLPRIISLGLNINL